MPKNDQQEKSEPSAEGGFPTKGQTSNDSATPSDKLTDMEKTIKAAN